MNNLKNKIFHPIPIIRYLLYSCIVTIIDTSIVWILYRLFNIEIITSNTVGVVSGFILHYIMSSRDIFDTDFRVVGFVIYFATFLVGLIMANGLIYIGKNYLFLGFQVDISFLLSKGISIIIPFFFLYFIRKILFDYLKKKDILNK